MTEEMIETLARCLCAADGHNPDEACPVDRVPGANHGLPKGPAFEVAVGVRWRAYRKRAIEHLTVASVLNP
jgi:hypothetical protein